MEIKYSQQIQQDSNLSGQKSHRCPWTIFWVALIVRLLYITLAHSYRFHNYPWPNHFQFGWEAGQIAAALSDGRGYSDPFEWGHTGPTAWLTPLFPLLLAGVFKLFGAFSLASGWVILAIDSVFSAFIVRTIWEIASRCFNQRVALWSSWIWALHPAAMQYAVRWVWDMTLTLLLFQWALVLALRMRGIGGTDGNRRSTSRWIWFGIVWGLIALSSPALLLVLPFCGLWILKGSPSYKQQLGRATLSAVLCLAVISPWTWRNWQVYHHFIPLRANFGVELYLGNSPLSGGLLAGYCHPSEAVDQFQAYARQGELEYSKSRLEAAKAIIREDRGHFAFLTLERIYIFWALGTVHTMGHPFNEIFRELNHAFASLVGLLGLILALRRKIPAAWLFAMAFLLIPLPYYATIVISRYRHPLEPLIVILGVFLFQSATKRSRSAKQPSGIEIESAQNT